MSTSGEMNFELPSELRMLQEAVRRFVDAEMIPVEMRSRVGDGMDPQIKADLVEKAKVLGLAGFERCRQLAVETSLVGQRVVNQCDEPQPLPLVFRFTGKRTKCEPIEEHDGIVGNRRKPTASVLARDRGWVGKTLMQRLHVHGPSESAKAASHSPARTFGNTLFFSSGEPAIAIAPEPGSGTAERKLFA